jgi:hypothetical protein
VPDPDLKEKIRPTFARHSRSAKSKAQLILQRAFLASQEDFCQKKRCGESAGRLGTNSAAGLLPELGGFFKHLRIEALHAIGAEAVSKLRVGMALNE